MQESKSSGSLASRVVLGCLGIVAVGLLCPAITVPGHSRKAATRQDCSQICGAINAYHEEYGHYPLGAAEESGGGHPEVIFGGTSGRSNSLVFDILRNIDSTGRTPEAQPNPYNPEGIVFFDGKSASDPLEPRSGFVPVGAKKGTVGAFMDP